MNPSLRSRVARGMEPRLAGLTASDMLSLEWDEELARGAQLWADQCIFQHDSNDVCRYILHFLRNYQNCPLFIWNYIFLSTYLLMFFFSL